MTILFHRAVKIGDNVVAIRALYALKCLFPDANLIVATNHIGANLYANLPFIDTLLDLEANPRAIYDINDIDYFIITHRIATNIALAQSTSAKKIILRAHLRSLLSPRFINDFNFFNKYRPESANLLRLARLIDRRIFDSGIESIDFSGAKLRFTRENSDFVERFLANGGGQNGENTTRFADKNRKIIGVNFFGSGGVAHLSLEAWREIVETLANENSECNFVILSAPTQKLQPFNAPNVAIFENNADLLNLVAIIARVSALISVDTGSVHIADNLQIPTVGIYTRKMAKRWRGGTYGGRFLQFIMPNDKNEMRDKQAVLGFLRANLKNFSTNLSVDSSANLTTISANPTQTRSAK